MKTLTYGNLEIQLDLTPDEEKIFLEAIQSDISAAKKFHARKQILQTSLRGRIA